MPTSGGVAAIYTNLDDTDPLKDGIAAAGDSTKASKSSHVHPLIFPFGVFVGSDGYPQLESTSTLCYFWIPTGGWLYWDTIQELLYIDGS